MKMAVVQDQGIPPGNPPREVNPKNAKTWKSLPEMGKEYLYKPSWKVCFPMKCLYIVAYEMYFPTLILYIYIYITILFIYCSSFVIVHFFSIKHVPTFTERFETLQIRVFYSSRIWDEFCYKVWGIKVVDLDIFISRCFLTWLRVSKPSKFYLGSCECYKVNI